MTRRFILTDIDHTLSDAFHRDNMIGGPWDEYHAAAAADEPVHDMVEVLRSFALNGFIIIGLTTRPEKWRQLTMDWCVKHDVPLDELLMRGDDDYRASHEIKRRQALERFNGEAGLRENVLLVMDDRDDVVAAFRALGVTVLQVSARRQG